MDYTILIQNMAFADAVKVITVGDRVIWQNNDAMSHSATRTDAPAFDTGLIKHGSQSAPITFGTVTAPGGIEYHCHPHPFMTAKLVVNPAAS